MDQLDLWKAFKQEKADDSNIMHNSKFAQIITWRFTGEDLAEECFPSGCCLQHQYANTDTSKMQATIEEANQLNREKKSPVERNT